MWTIGYLWALWFLCFTGGMVMRGHVARNRLNIVLFILVYPMLVASPQHSLKKGSVLITHISPDYGQATEEFVVLFNASAETVNLVGYELRYFTASGSQGSAGRVFSGSVLLPPGEHFLLSNHDTVFIGNVTVISDAFFTGGMASTGGQLVLRSSSEHDTIVYAAAWGSVSAFVAEMSDAAPWEGDGLIMLDWQDSVYDRSAHNFSNLEYVHVARDSVTFVPSLAGSVEPTSGGAWMIRLDATQGQNTDSSAIIMGTDPSATDGFDPLFDLPQPPLPPGDNIVSTGLYRPDLSLATGDYLMHDFRSQRSLSDTTVRWFVDVFPADPAARTGALHVGQIHPQVFGELSNQREGLDASRRRLIRGRVARCEDLGFLNEIADDGGRIGGTPGLIRPSDHREDGSHLECFTWSCTVVEHHALMR